MTRLLDVDALNAAQLEEWGWLLRREADRKRRRLAKLGKAGWYPELPRPRMMPAAQVERVTADAVADDLPEEAMTRAIMAMATESGLETRLARRAAARGVLAGRRRHDGAT